MILETTAPAPIPKINPTKLILARPTSSQTSAPMIVSTNAIVVVIFIITLLIRLLLAKREGFTPIY